MTKQERMDILERLSLKLDRIIEILENNKRYELDIQFTKANANANDSELKSYEMEFFQKLDRSKGE